jgi:hypothetical protein
MITRATRRSPLTTNVTSRILYVHRTYRDYRMQKKLTISIDEKVYKALHRKIGQGQISRFIEGLLRPLLMQRELEDGYRSMSLDQKREKASLDWAEEMVGDISDA